MVEKVSKGKLDARGAELVDSVPVAPPVGYKPQPSMFEVMRTMIRNEKIKAALEEEGLETPEEADDFDVDDDYDPNSPYEYNFDHVADMDELKRVREQIDARARELRAASFSSSSGNISAGGGGAGRAGSPESAAARPSEDPAGKVK